MPKITVLYLIQFFGMWINIFIGVMGMITYIIPLIQGQDPIAVTAWFRYPLLLPVIYGCSIYMIVGAGGLIDEIVRENAKKNQRRGGWSKGQ